VVDGCAVITLA